MIEQSKYPEIIIDEARNSVNENLNARLNIEQLYDLMHHTHNVKDLIGTISTDDGSTAVTDEQLVEVNQKINTLTQTTDANTVNIQQLSTKVSQLSSSVDTMSDQIANINIALNAMNEKMDNIMKVLDEQITSRDA